MKSGEGQLAAWELRGASTTLIADLLLFNNPALILLFLGRVTED
jgi:hypothetical protein